MNYTKEELDQAWNILTEEINAEIKIAVKTRDPTKVVAMIRERGEIGKLRRTK